MGYAEDIRLIVGVKNNKNGIEAEENRSSILGDSKAIVTNTTKQGSVSLVPPLTFEALTYDATKDVTITDDAGTVQVFKQVATARIIDLEGTIVDIDTVIFNQ